MASGLRVARNELELVSIRSSRTAIEIRYIRLKASSSKQTCFSNSSTRPVSASTRRWSFFSLSFLRALYSSFFLVWRARIRYSNWENDIYIGSFDEEQEAARAVDEYLASIGYERRNFPEDEVEDLEDLGGDAVSSPQ